jgi:hypothetical protein
VTNLQQMNLDDANTKENNKVHKQQMEVSTEKRRACDFTLVLYMARFSIDMLFISC